MIQHTLRWGLVFALAVLFTACATSTPKAERKKRTEEAPAAVQAPVAPTPAPPAGTPGVPSGMTPQQQTTYQLAITALRDGKDSTAEQLFTALAQSNPTITEVNTNLGIIHFRNGRYAQAEEAFNRAVQADAANAIAYNYLGIVYRVKGQFQEAKAAYNHALSINPNYALAQLNLGILYDLYLRDLGSAMESYRKYQQMVPQEDKEVTKWIADLKRRQESGK